MKDATSAMQEEIHHSYENVELLRLHPDGSVDYTSDTVITEQPVTIMIDRVGSFTVMSTPSEIEALAIGFIFSEGMIDTIEEVVATYIKPDLPNVIGVEIQDPTRIRVGRNLIVSSSCGMCGVRNIEKMVRNIPPCKWTIKVTDGLLIETMQKLKDVQHVFNITGGSHGAAIFNSNGEIIAFAEDIGRHNALDKAIGKCLLAGFSPKSCCVALSGRVSLEIVTKAAKAGIEVIAAVSAVSSYAISAANKWNITLCGFVRPDKINVYTKHARVITSNK